MSDETTGTVAPVVQSIVGGDGQPGAEPATQQAGATTQEGTTTTTQSGEGASVVPEKYEFTLPEGITADETLGKFEPLFRELELSNDKAQKLVSMFAELKQAELQSESTRLAEQHEAWKQAVLSDKELGGAKFVDTAKFAQTAVARFGTPALKEFLNNSGAGSHPELVRFAAAIGRAMSEDSIHAGKASGSESNLFDLYPSMRPTT